MNLNSRQKLAKRMPVTVMCHCAEDAEDAEDADFCHRYKLESIPRGKI